MYLEELLNPEVQAARLPDWPDGVYIRFNWIGDKLHPVCRLEDSWTLAGREFLVTQFMSHTGDGWVAWTPPPQTHNDLQWHGRFWPYPNTPR